MYFRQILHPDLGCASYLLADSGEAAVIDPKWEIAEYLQAADEAGARIQHVLETHHHADHVSGRRRLTAATGAVAHVPGEPDAEPQPGGRPDRGPGAHPGDVVRVGDVSLLALGTPGHRPEHLAYLVCPRGRAHDAALSGDSLLFVGDVARPDLAVAPAEGARALWHTLRRLSSLRHEVEVWPAHVGGSLCASQSASSEGHRRPSATNCQTTACSVWMISRPSSRR